MRDQEGMRAIVAAVDALQDDPYPSTDSTEATITG
jgi:hypothetical protein